MRVETPDGRAEYAAAQRAFADRVAVLRDRLLAAVPARPKARLTRPCGYADVDEQVGHGRQVVVDEPGSVHSVRCDG
ncbi:hypothetical protein [Micromonospora sp. DT231]|uniref:hypothetical protein n=1 Tax=Micromonospora sp. DT231 TaxID=3416526 RepID=UPI003CF7179C